MNWQLKSRTPQWWSGFSWGVLSAIVAYLTLIVCCAPTTRGVSKYLEATEGTLMLVRFWDVEDGTLIVWLPIHRCSMEMNSIVKDRLKINLNDAIIGHLPNRPSDPESRAVIIAKESRIIEGKKWLPVERDPNLVWIQGFPFAITKIDFSEKYRLPTPMQEPLK